MDSRLRITGRDNFGTIGSWNDFLQTGASFHIPLERWWSLQVVCCRKSFPFSFLRRKTFTRSILHRKSNSILYLGFKSLLCQRSKSRKKFHFVSKSLLQSNYKRPNSPPTTVLYSICQTKLLLQFKIDESINCGSRQKLIKTFKSTKSAKEEFGLSFLC